MLTMVSRPATRRLRGVKICCLFSIGLTGLRPVYGSLSSQGGWRPVHSPVSGFPSVRRTVSATSSAALPADASGWARCRLAKGPATRPTRVVMPLCDGGRARPQPPAPGGGRDAVAHDDVSQQLPAMANDSLLEPVNQPTSVRIITDDLLSGIAPGHHVINGALEFNPQSSWHIGSLDVWTPVTKPKTKNKV